VLRRRYVTIIIFLKQNAAMQEKLLDLIDRVGQLGSLGWWMYKGRTKLNRAWMSFFVSTTVQSHPLISEKEPTKIFVVLQIRISGLTEINGEKERHVLGLTTK